MAQINGITFEFSGLTGHKDALWNRLEFALKFRYNPPRGQPTRFYGEVSGATLFISAEIEEIEAGQLEVVDTGIKSIDEGGETTVRVVYRASDVFLQRLIEASNRRVFRIIVRVVGNCLRLESLAQKPIRPGLIIPTTHSNTMLNWGTFIDYFSEGKYLVRGKVDDVDNSQCFQIGPESWKRTINALKTGTYQVRSVFIRSPTHSEISRWTASLIEAENRLLEGMPRDALAQIRSIPESLGRKEKGAPDRYFGLKGFELTDKEREELQYLLDFLWAWTSKGHHNTGAISENRAKIAIDTAYSLVSYLSDARRQQSEESEIASNSSGRVVLRD